MKRMIFMIVGLVLLFLGFIYAGTAYIQRKYYPDAINPYTKKTNFDKMLVSVQAIAFILVGIAVLFANVLVGLLIIVSGLGMGAIFWKTSFKKEETLLEILYDENDLTMWQSAFDELRAEKRATTRKTNKVVITNENIYLSKRKKLAFIKTFKDNIKFERAELKNNFLRVEYSYTGIVVRIWYIYVPKAYENQVKQLLKKRK
jgi:heme/copper-type cytochrome/quinol oxidase subunit 1